VNGDAVIPLLQIARLRLEPLRAEHAEELAPVLYDPDLHTFTSGRPATRPELRDRYPRQVHGHSPDGSAHALKLPGVLMQALTHIAPAVGLVAFIPMITSFSDVTSPLGIPHRFRTRLLGRRRTTSASQAGSATCTSTRRTPTCSAARTVSRR